MANTVMIIALLLFSLVNLYILLTVKAKKENSGIPEITSLLASSGEQQRESVAKLLDATTTRQFEHFGLIQQNANQTMQDNQQSLNKTLQDNRTETNKTLQEFAERLDNQLSSIRRSNIENNDKMNATLETKIKALQESNEKRLEQMQGVVDEKLQKTLETRLSLAFENVSKQLDSVQQGLGEMKNLAADAKSLKNALTKVRDRGAYGEVRLEKLLSDILAPNQYEINVEINDNKRVEFAIKYPGHGDTPVLLPIDSKFPIEDYNRLLEAEEKQTIDQARKALATKIRGFANDIQSKYIVPPKTMDFALMFLPTEGLYAEIIQNVALFEELRDKYKVIAVGPMTLSAILNSIQIGFKTLALEQRSLEVWDTLRDVKAQFNKFGGMLEKAQTQVQRADKTLTELISVRKKALDRALRDVEMLDGSAALPRLEESLLYDDGEDGEEDSVAEAV
ncbi:MAG: DNA recombination protein RmuC [Clostridia bacterium]|nr:DNA recombination protein RmuC [Clostridia bacterium]